VSTLLIKNIGEFFTGDIERLGRDLAAYKRVSRVVVIIRGIA
jgi:hypothetical protein